MTDYILCSEFTATLLLVTMMVMSPYGMLKVEKESLR